MLCHFSHAVVVISVIRLHRDNMDGTMETLAVVFDCCRHIPARMCCAVCALSCNLNFACRLINLVVSFFASIIFIFSKNSLLRLSLCANFYLDSDGHYRPSSAPPSFLRRSLQLHAARATPSRILHLVHQQKEGLITIPYQSLRLGAVVVLYHLGFGCFGTRPFQWKTLRVNLPYDTRDPSITLSKLTFPLALLKPIS